MPAHRPIKKIIFPNIAPANQTRAQITIEDTSEDDNASFDYLFGGSNPRLVPTLASAFSIGAEWYFSRAGLFNVALHYKELENVRSTMRIDRFGVTDYNPITQTNISGDISYRYPEGNGSGAIYVAEVSMVEALDFLPGFLTHTGYTINYTYSNNNVTASLDGGGFIELNGPSKHAVNTQLYYDDGKLNALLAYSWRDKRPANRGSNTYVTPYDDYRKSLNASLSYRFSVSIQASLQIQNVLDERISRYSAGAEDMKTHIAETGRRYLFGL